MLAFERSQALGNPGEKREESMDSDTDRVVASLNLEEIINNYNT